MGEVSAEIEKLIAGRWIAGAKIDDAIKKSRALNRSKIRTQINYLGELFMEKADVNDAVNTYLKLVNKIDRSTDSDIALKATQLGLLMGKKFAASMYGRVVEQARKKKIFVWLDMEEQEHIDDTIDIYYTQLRNAGVGLCIQSYLKRSENDIRELVGRGAVIRLVKGAHSNPKNRVYLQRPEATRNYAKLMQYLFANSERFMIGTHDDRLIEKARLLNKRYRRIVEYGMLNGIRQSYALKLADAGERVNIYVPFGPRWIDYSYRRLKEASNLKLIVRSLIQK